MAMQPMLYLAQYLVLLGCPSIYLILLISDVYKSWHPHYFWVAPKFLSLNAFTLEIMSELVNTFRGEYVSFLIRRQHLVDATRLMGCITIAYVIPEVAQYSVSEAWEYLGTVLLTGLVQVIYRIYSFLYEDVGDKKYEAKWFTISTGVHFVAFFFLFLVLACTLAAGKTMKALVMNRIRRRISEHRSPRSQSAPPIPIDEVFYELWLAVRSSRPSNVAGRSVLSSASTFIASLLVGFNIAKLSLLSKHRDMFLKLATIDKAVVVVEWIFIMVGWFVLLWRWFATVYYFSFDNSPYCLSKYITQSEKEVNYREKFSIFHLPSRIMEDILIIVPSVVHHFLKPVFCIMKSFILLCEIGSNFFHRLRILFKKIIKSNKQQQTEEYTAYINNLKDFTMFGEPPQSLWESNFRAFQKVKTQVQKGNGKGKKLWEDIQGLYDGVDHPQLHFNEQCCWKMEVIWYLTLLMCCYCDSNSNKEAEEAIAKAIECCRSNLWNILTLMEPTESNNVIADNEFRRLQLLWQKCCKRRSKANRYLEDEVKRPLKEAFKKLHSGYVDRDDWKRQEMARYFHTRCKPSDLIDCDKMLADTMDKGTKWILANLYYTLRHCICEYMQEGVLERCYEWAAELDEDNLCDAASKIGMALGLIDAASEVQGLHEPANVV